MIDATTPAPGLGNYNCSGCAGEKGAPLAVEVRIGPPATNMRLHISLCQECARDFANAVGFFCIKDGGWSKLEPRKRARRTP